MIKLGGYRKAGGGRWRAFTTPDCRVEAVWRSVDVSVPIAAERQHFGFEFFKAAAVEDAVAFVEQGDGFGAHDLSVGSGDFLDADRVGWGAALLIGSIGRLLDDVSHHAAAEVEFDHHVVGVEIIAGADDGQAA